jgi:hypothetical protein
VLTVEHLLALHVLGSPDRLQRGGLTEFGNVNGHQRSKNEVRHVGRGPVCTENLV